ncbi:hypothetical protein [uncultured Maribacter sp.]|uniref:hypothetical protein n=1 Tax=uncultured Maribacter sp. TaxID=431308 RepID=UPI002628AB4F|nr:hypothetical protein [uncultured Maribacter sp.]
MEENKIRCEEFTGLFVVRNCENKPTIVCYKCKKNVCNIHAFKANKIVSQNSGLQVYKKKNAILCISCFVEFDARLTNDIELYSKDRSVWRRKMINRFHEEYPYMVFMADDYGGLFDSSSTVFLHDDSDDGSYFDS